MSTSPQSPHHDTQSQELHRPILLLANGIGSGEAPSNEGDDRSSSLSDIEDRTANTELALASHNLGGGSEANDTEAETERLEDSPQKVQRHTNVVLSLSNDVYHESANVVQRHLISANDNAHRANLGPPDERGFARETDIVNARMDQTSDISSLEDSSEEIERLGPPSSTSLRKRKRKSPPSGSRSGDEKTGKVMIGTIQSPLEHALLHSNSADNQPKVEAVLADNDLNSGIDKVEYTENGVETTSSQHLSPSKSKSKKGKRKAKRTKDEDPEQTTVTIAYVDSQVEHFHSMERLDSNGEDAEMEDIGDGAEADVAARTEEGLMKKKSAMDSLGAIEKCFATLRDKLFDERLGQYNDELAMLNQPISNHPEYLAQKEVIDRYRDDKLDYEETLFKFKLIALQRKSIAEKAQIHSQYMQTVREIRDRNLEQLNKEWYQIQRERRSCEDSESDYIYKFPTRRSQQIRQQTAYNTEVSILSGLAKYVGFPAAPDIMGARPSEIDDDLAEIAAAMGTNIQASHTMQRQPPSLRANSSSATAGFSRQKPAAEERFLEQNPWANPQHPAHHQQHHPVQRQMSNLSRPASPFSTPMGQRRIVDFSLAQGSASTIAELQSGPSSSMAPTPATGEQAVKSGRLNQSFLADSTSSTTPSRIVETPINGAISGPIAPELPSHKLKSLLSGTPDRPGVSSSLNNPSQNMSKDAPKPLPLQEDIPLISPSHLPHLPTSPQTQYLVIKAEDTSQPPQRSPALNRYEPPESTRIAANGHHERFSML